HKFSDRAPAGTALVRFFIGRAGLETIVDAPDERLVRIARDELAQLFGVTAAPSLARVYRWPRSTPQYGVGHSRAAGRTDRARASSHLRSRGRRRARGRRLTALLGLPAVVRPPDPRPCGPHRGRGIARRRGAWHELRRAQSAGARPRPTRARLRAESRAATLR